METKQKPTFGTISHATMRAQDLIPAFMYELQSLNPQQYANFKADLDNAEIWRWLANPDEISEPESVQYFLNELWEALNSEALPYTYFCAHPGDGSDYGFWPDIDALEQDADFCDGVLKVNAGDEWPSIPTGVNYVMEVNDHGNVTLFDAASREEIWSCV